MQYISVDDMKRAGVRVIKQDGINFTFEEDTRLVRKDKAPTFKAVLVLIDGELKFAI